MQKLHSIPCLLLAAVLLAGCGAQETAQDSRPPAESIRTSMREDYTTAELVSDMGLGINLGNTLEACGDWIQGDSVTSYETAWGSPVVTEEMIAGYAKAGFQTRVRRIIIGQDRGLNDVIGRVITDGIDGVHVNVRFGHFIMTYLDITGIVIKKHG